MRSGLTLCDVINLVPDKGKGDFWVAQFAGKHFSSCWIISCDMGTE
jgi:hypothetical protein